MYCTVYLLSKYLFMTNLHCVNRWVTLLHCIWPHRTQIVFGLKCLNVHLKRKITILWHALFFTAAVLLIQIHETCQRIHPCVYIAADLVKMEVGGTPCSAAEKNCGELLCEAISKTHSLCQCWLDIWSIPNIHVKQSRCSKRFSWKLCCSVSSLFVFFFLET